MRFRLQVLLVIATGLLWTFVPTARAGTFTARLDLAGSTVTPIPVTFRIMFINETGEPRVVPRQAALIVTPSDGPSFVARWRGRSIVELAAHGYGGIVVQPGESAAMEILSNLFFDSPGWFTDPRVYAVGKKSLQLVFGDNLETVVADDGGSSLLRASDSIASSVAVLEVKRNSEDDAAVCTLVAERLGITEPCPMHAIGAQQHLIRDAVDNYPKSSYQQFLVARVPDDVVSRIARIEASLPGQSEPTLSWNLLELASLSDYEMGDALSKKDRRRAKQFAQKADEAYQRLTRSPFQLFRSTAAERRENLADFRKDFEIE